MSIVANECPDILGQSYKCPGVTWCPEDPIRDILGQSWDILQAGVD